MFGGAKPTKAPLPRGDGTEQRDCRNGFERLFPVTVTLQIKIVTKHSLYNLRYNNEITFQRNLR